MVKKDRAIAIIAKTLELFFNWGERSNCILLETTCSVRLQANEDLLALANIYKAEAR